MTTKAERWKWVEETALYLEHFKRAEMKLPEGERLDWAEVQKKIADAVKVWTGKELLLRASTTDQATRARLLREQAEMELDEAKARLEKLCEEQGVRRGRSLV